MSVTSVIIYISFDFNGRINFGSCFVRPVLISVA
jgi:hypothetical protein